VNAVGAFCGASAGLDAALFRAARRAIYIQPPATSVAGRKAASSPAPYTHLGVDLSNTATKIHAFAGRLRRAQRERRETYPVDPVILSEFS